MEVLPLRDSDELQILLVTREVVNECL